MLANVKDKAVFTAVRLLAPALLGAVGGVAAQAFPAYFNIFCGLG